MRETHRAKEAWAAYAARGGSLSDLCAYFRQRQAAGERVPTVHMSALKGWSAEFGWQARLKTIADQQAREAEERLAADMREVMETGPATVHGRVRILKQVVGDLYSDLTATGKRNRRWVDGKFNSTEYERLFNALDDLAKETGGRKPSEKIDITIRIREEAIRRGVDPDLAVEAADEIIRDHARRR